VAKSAGQSPDSRTCQEIHPILRVGGVGVIKNIKVSAGNWIRFRVELSSAGNVGYHPGKPDLECTCNSYKPGKPCSHVEWLAREFTYDKTFEDIRALIEKETGVDYPYTVIEDLWDKCLKTTNVRLYESLKQGTKTSKNPLNFKLEREGTFGVDTSSKKDETIFRYLTANELNSVTGFQKELLDSLSIEIENNLFNGNTATTTTTISTSGKKEEWVYMDPKAWGTKVFQFPYIKEEQQEPEPTEKPTEEPKPPPKPKNRFSEMEL